MNKIIEQKKRHWENVIKPKIQEAINKLRLTVDYELKRLDSEFSDYDISLKIDELQCGT